MNKADSDIARRRGALFWCNKKKERKVSDGINHYNSGKSAGNSLWKMPDWV
jgi:hypothetical protein